MKEDIGLSGQGQVRCRCGQTVATEPRLDARCPHCGHQLFWECKCKQIVERTLHQCPHCGLSREAVRRRTRRRRISLRRAIRWVLIGGSIGIVAGLIFSVIGQGIAGWLFPMSVSLSSNPTPVSTIVARPSFLVGILLVLGDVVNFVGDIFVRHPISIALGVAGGVLGLWYAAYRQKMTFQRLVRHIKRKRSLIKVCWCNRKQPIRDNS